MLYKNILTPVLLQILEITGVSHQHTLPSIVSSTQQMWLRKSGCERWEIDNRFESLSEELMPLFKNLGILDAIMPAQKAYDYVILPGDLATPFRHRLAYLFALYKAGIRFKKIVIHTGDRPLVEQFESRDVLYNPQDSPLSIRPDWQPVELPQTETQMIRMILNQTKWPEELENRNIEIYSAPMRKNPDGSLRRPNTADVIRIWLSQDIKSGSVLVISDQPYVCYQHAVFKTLLPRSFKIETVGPAADLPLLIGDVLDNLARWLYQENIFISSSP